MDVINKILLGVMLVLSTTCWATAGQGQTREFFAGCDVQKIIGLQQDALLMLRFNVTCKGTLAHRISMLQSRVELSGYRWQEHLESSGKSARLQWKKGSMIFVAVGVSEEGGTKFTVSNWETKQRPVGVPEEISHLIPPNSERIYVIDHQVDNAMTVRVGNSRSLAMNQRYLENALQREQWQFVSTGKTGHSLSIQLLKANWLLEVNVVESPERAFERMSIIDFHLVDGT